MASRRRTSEEAQKLIASLPPDIIRAIESYNWNQQFLLETITFKNGHEVPVGQDKKTFTAHCIMVYDV